MPFHPFPNVTLLMLLWRAVFVAAWSPEKEAGK